MIVVNNRGSSGYGKTFLNSDTRRHGRDDIDDFIWAIKHFNTLGVVDEKRTAIMGGSYGGYITMAALCFRPKSFQCGVNIVGVTNWVRTLKSIPLWWNEYRNDLYNYMGNPDTEEEYLKSISPLYSAHLIEKPFLVLQGANDPRVLQAESDDIVAAARKNGVEVEYLLFPDEGHGFSRKQNMLKANQTILSFLRDKLLK